MKHIRTLIAAVIAALALTAAIALPATASVRVPCPPRTAVSITPVVYVVSEHGVITSPCVLHVGERLLGIGPAPAVETVTSLTPDGPVDRVGLSTPLPGSGIFDFRAPTH